MADIEIEGLEEIFEALDKLALKGVSLSPVMQEIGNIVKNEAEMSFENQASPFGGGWTPTKSKELGKQILIASGVLKGSFSVDADSDSVSVGTNVVYAAIHHFGGSAGRGHSVELPARPFMPMDDSGNIPQDLEDEIMEYLAEELLEE